MSAEILQLIIAALLAIGVGAGTYAAIKSDLTRAILMAENARDSGMSAHRRIDDHINMSHNT